jgi:hypothetical protein
MASGIVKSRNTSDPVDAGRRTPGFEHRARVRWMGPRQSSLFAPVGPRTHRIDGPLSVRRARGVSPRESPPGARPWGAEFVGGLASCQAFRGLQIHPPQVDCRLSNMHGVRSLRRRAPPGLQGSLIAGERPLVPATLRTGGCLYDPAESPDGAAGLCPPGSPSPENLRVKIRAIRLFGLGQRVFSPQNRVRIPDGPPDAVRLLVPNSEGILDQRPHAERVYLKHMRGSRKDDTVGGRTHNGPPLRCGVGQRSARLAHNQEVTGSNPVPATIPWGSRGDSRSGRVTEG